MNVRELIEYLSTVDPELTVVYQIYSEQSVLDGSDIEIKKLCKAREDGWVQNYRPDKPSMDYLVLPGN